MRFGMCRKRKVVREAMAQARKKRSASGRSAETLPGNINHLARHLLAVGGAIRERVSSGILARGHKLNASATQLLPNLPLEGLGMSELAERLRLTLQRTGQLVQQLEDEGYLERVPDEIDGRAKRVVYTRSGRALVKDIDEVVLGVTQELADVLGAARFERLCADLAALDEGINGEDAALLLPPRA